MIGREGLAKTYVAKRITPPGSSAVESGTWGVVSLPKAPWEEARTKDEVLGEIREQGGLVVGGRKV